MKARFLLIVFIILSSVISCRKLPPSNRVFVIQPFTGMPSSQITSIYEMLKKINPKTFIREAIPIPESAFYSPRNRYRADSIINYLKHCASTDTVFIGLTNKDISISKRSVKDWGVMGLGFEPGNACIVSTYRLSGNNLLNQLNKLTLHELGHTQGLPHCNIKECFMRDAEGTNHFDEETGFFQSCKSFLKSKGWSLR